MNDRVHDREAAGGLQNRSGWNGGAGVRPETSTDHDWLPALLIGLLLPLLVAAGLIVEFGAGHPATPDRPVLRRDTTGAAPLGR